MHIPPFDHNFVLPPELTDMFGQREMSPYPCDILEFCERFGTSAHRRNLLKGFLAFRLECLKHGVSGWQWVDGSFVEAIEESQHRDPSDIDVVTMYMVKSRAEEQRLMEAFPDLADEDETIDKYGVHNISVNINENVKKTVAVVKYWLTMFGYNDKDVRKGMLEIPLYDTPEKDKEALDYLNTF